ncbi:MULTISPECIES: hypothetical protein [unclassified Paenibacillus]|uniref:hypothetical protein n=1 Tax=unclassified Paenibacillus TaxID=185978 RepID=UPI00020D78E3|nr:MULTISPECIES: hypothetical protein [unclassified Paenibacillus]EGL17399.1 hypothetical protein HMPREF9413_1493 [Paenibacillus sp. HGF7]
MRTRRRGPATVAEEAAAEEEEEIQKLPSSGETFKTSSAIEMGAGGFFEVPGALGNRFAFKQM